MGADIAFRCCHHLARSCESSAATIRRDGVPRHSPRLRLPMAASKDHGHAQQERRCSSVRRHRGIQREILPSQESSRYADWQKDGWAYVRASDTRTARGAIVSSPSTSTPRDSHTPDCEYIARRVTYVYVLATCDAPSPIDIRALIAGCSFVFRSINVCLRDPCSAGYPQDPSVDLTG